MKQNFTFSITISSRKLFSVVLPLAALMLATGIITGIVVVDRLVMPNVVRVNKGIVEVPSIVNLPFEQGRQMLYDIGLRGREVAREFDALIAEGNIVRQSPAAGSSVKKGRQIELVVSRGLEVGLVPHIEGLTERQARVEIEKEGFTVGSVSKIFSAEVSSDKIIAVTPAPGTKTSRALPLELVISKGLQPTHAVMPNVIGESLSAAQQKIEEEGLSVGNVEYETNPTLQPGTVVSQSVAPGTKISLDKAVDIVVSVSN
jgi:serine/threonine-protein kinase